MAMVEGRAVGGPRDGIKLTADYNWNGQVRKPQLGSGIRQIDNQARYPGRYIWNPFDCTWDWHAGEFILDPRLRTYKWTPKT